MRGQLSKASAEDVEMPQNLRDRTHTVTHGEKGKAAVSTSVNRMNVNVAVSPVSILKSVSRSMGPEVVCEDRPSMEQGLLVT